MKGIMRAALFFVVSFAFAFGANEKETKENRKSPDASGGEARSFVALVLPGPANDGGWSESAYDGLVEIGEKFGAKTAFLENVPPSDFEESFAGFAARGADIVFGHGFEFGEAARKVAPRFPQTTFLITSSDIAAAPNLGSITNNIWEAGYLAGVIAASLSETGKIGAVGGMDIPSISGSLDAFAAGAARVNPAIKTTIVYTGSFEDAAKAKENALALIESGADILFHNADQSAVGIFEACRSRGVRAIGMISDQSAFAPDTIVTSALCAVSESMTATAARVFAGTWQPQSYLLGAKDGVVGLSPWGKFDTKVSAAVKERVAAVLDDMKTGKLDAVAATAAFAATATYKRK